MMLATKKTQSLPPVPDSYINNAILIFLHIQTKVSTHFDTASRRMATNDKEFLIQQAILYEHAELFEDMVEVMKAVVAASGGDLGDNERKMLSNAYKSVINKKRSAWRKIVWVDHKLGEDNPKKPMVKRYLDIIAKDLTESCTELLMLLDHLIPKASTPEATVFFMKMKADHFRYLVEIFPKEDDARQQCKQTYIEATEISEGKLGAAHPFRLGLALNFSVFEYEIEDSCSAACEMADKAFKAAMEELEKVDESEMEDTTTMMQLLRDNLTFWNEENQTC